jgi:hypothetical protein
MAGRKPAEDGRDPAAILPIFLDFNGFLGFLMHRARLLQAAIGVPI